MKLNLISIFYKRAHAHHTGDPENIDIAFNTVLASPGIALHSTDVIPGASINVTGKRDCRNVWFDGVYSALFSLNI